MLIIMLIVSALFFLQFYISLLFNFQQMHRNIGALCDWARLQAQIPHDESPIASSSSSSPDQFLPRGIPARALHERRFRKGLTWLLHFVWRLYYVFYPLESRLIIRFVTIGDKHLHVDLLILFPEMGLLRGTHITFILLYWPKWEVGGHVPRAPFP